MQAQKWHFYGMKIKRMEVLLFLADVAVMVVLIYGSIRREKALAKNA
jgi:hypothetical protein